MTWSDAPRWTAGRLTALTALAAAFPLAAALAERGTGLLVPLALGLGLALAWRTVFERLGGRPMGWDAPVAVMIAFVFLPAQIPFWPLALALSFGLVLGEMIFGGRGRGFLSPACTALAFLVFAFPATSAATPGPLSVAALIAGGAVLLAAGLLSWRVVVGFVAVLGILGLSLAWPPVLVTWPGAGLVLAGLVFLAGDPVAAPGTNAGRWLHGGLTGWLVWMLAGQGATPLTATVVAAFMASLLAPLIDQAVIAANVRRRSRRVRDV